MPIFYTPGKRALLFLSLLTFSAVNAQMPQTTAPAARPQPQTPADSKQKGMDLLRKNIRLTGLSQAELDSYQVTDAYPDKASGSFLVYLQQGYLGVPVYNKIGVYVFRNDTLVEKKANFIPAIALKAGPQVSYSVEALQAIHFAAGHLALTVRQTPRMIQKDDVRRHYLFSNGGVSKKNISSDLVWLPVNDSKEVKLSWNVRIVTPDGSGDWLVRIDAQTGQVIEKSNLIVSEKAKDCMMTDQPAGSLAVAPDPDRAAPNLNRAARNPDRAAPVWGGNAVAVAGAQSGSILGQSRNIAAPPPAVTSASYRIYPFPTESANFGPRVLSTNPWLIAGSGNNATSLGWHFDNTTSYDYTRGNNVWALEDTLGTTDGTGFSDTSTTIIPALTFDRTLAPTQRARAYTNIRAGLDNLFYANNTMHDISYQYGFDEAAGNFQASNQGRGGQEGDFVYAFAQEAQGLNNAFFATGPDGESPSMLMYVWNSLDTASLHINTPGAITGDYAALEGVFSAFNRLAVQAPITGNIIQVNDDINPATHLGCGTGFSNSVAGKIALIDRGSCNYTLKVKNAQVAGAIAVIMVNNAAGPPIVMGGDDATITIPAIMISQTDGATLKANLASLNGTLNNKGEDLDGALDNGVMAHEYTHGISNRLTGGPANADCLLNAEQMGEGWSDFMALMVTTDWSTAAVTDGPKKRSLGTYVAGQVATGPGIRHYPYSTDKTINKWTYDSVAVSTGGEVHAIGEIWCATLWDMAWNIIQQEGISGDIYHGTKGNNMALQLVIEGMKLQPCSPGFVDGRDAILKADSLLYNYSHKCAIWKAFAGRGIGKSASQGSSNSYLDQTSATDLPSGLSLTQTVNKTTLAQGDDIFYTVKASCNCTPLTGITIVDTLSANLSYVSSSGGTYTAPYVKFTGNDFAAGETKTFTVEASVAGTYAVPDTLMNDSRDPANYTWTPTLTTGGTIFADVTTRAHSGTHSWYAANRAGQTDFALTTGDLHPDSISTLSFWHYYETESAFDGGVVEISTDNGNSWSDLGPYMTQNGYNNTLDPTTAGIPNRQAFSGSSGGSFIRTVISLTGFSGATAKIRFRFGSSPLQAGDGWYIDDILLTNENGAFGIAAAFSGTTLLDKKISSSPFAPVALPVNFLSFDAKKSGKTAQLHWTVSGETGADKYIIERSTDGNTFLPIGEVATDPAISADGTKDYSYTDDQPVIGNDFYRIREKDLDGHTTISVTKLLRFASDQLVITLSPVPTYTHMVQLEIEADNDEPMAASLVNMIGQTLKVYSVRTGVNQLNLENYSKGVYFLKIQTSHNSTEIRKLVIQ